MRKRNTQGNIRKSPRRKEGHAAEGRPGAKAGAGQGPKAEKRSGATPRNHASDHAREHTPEHTPEHTKGESGNQAKTKAMTRSGKRPASADTGRMIYGMNPVMEALRSGAAEAVYIYSGRRRQATELMEEAGARGAALKVIHDMGFFDSRFPKGHQGVAADLKEAAVYDVSDLMNIPGQRGEQAFFLLLDGIEDPRNLGAILRSAEAAGVHGVVMEKRRCAPIGPEAVKASAGSALHIPVAVVSNIKNAMRQMKDEGIAIVGAEAGSPMRPDAIDMQGPIALVVGSEGSGLRRTVLEACDFVASLPIRGMVNSLNASVAAGILVYEVVRQRG